MRIERAILIAFLGNYLINNIVGAVVAMLPLGTGGSTGQYIGYIALAGIAAAIFTWWYFMGVSKNGALVNGILFGLIAFATAIVTAFVSGVSGVLTQSGSISQLISVLPNFGPYFMNWSTVALLGYWIVPAAVVGWLLGMGKKAPVAPASPMTQAPRPMI